MKENLYQIHLIIEREGNQRVNGLAATPIGCPPGKLFPDTTLSSRCKGFVRQGQDVPMVKAIEMSPVRGRKIMGTRALIFRGHNSIYSLLMQRTGSQKRYGWPREPGTRQEIYHLSNRWKR